LTPSQFWNLTFPTIKLSRVTHDPSEGCV